jgi:hypothetical protein
MDKYPTILLKDPFAEDNWEICNAFNKNCHMELVGDDLLATNTTWTETSKDNDACGLSLLRINHTRTIIESLEAFVLSPGSFFHYLFHPVARKYQAMAGKTSSRIARVGRWTTVMRI